MNRIKFSGLVAATPTPFGPDGSLNLKAVERQVEHLLGQGLRAAFVCGSTGESQSLSFTERAQLGRRWLEAARGTPLRVAIHVGSNCLAEARELAGQAGKLGATAIAAIAPYYFKPRNLEGLVDWCAAIATAAPETPFYFYDVPALTHVNFPMPEFLSQAADRIPTLNGIKFTNNDLLSYQRCLGVDEGAFDIPWGIDESMLAAFALGGTSAVGSTYNFAAPIFHRLLSALGKGDLMTARREQERGTSLIQLLLEYGYLGAAKQILKWQGVDLGLCRPPIPNLNSEQAAKLRRELEAKGFLELNRLSGDEAPGGAPVRPCRHGRNSRESVGGV